MATIDGNSFELERRFIQLKYNTNMPAAVGGGVLGYDGDPNSVTNGANSGETLIYNVALGASFLQSNGTLWYKQELPNKWVIIGGSTSTLNSTVVTKTVAAGATENFYTLALANNENFEFMNESTFGSDKSYSKYSALYTGSSVVWNEYSFLGSMIDMDVEITVSGTDCVFNVTNNEASDVTCSVKVETYNEL
jgi:hypothetical protein